jgi:hypothetical protein
MGHLHRVLGGPDGDACCWAEGGGPDVRLTVGAGAGWDVEVRRRTVEVLGRARSLVAAIDRTDDQALALDMATALALVAGDDQRGRELLARKVELVRRRDGLIDELQRARCQTRELTARMLHLERGGPLPVRARRRETVPGPAGGLDVEVDVAGWA